jgi:hypothetical protein
MFEVPLTLLARTGRAGRRVKDIDAAISQIVQGLAASGICAVVDHGDALFQRLTNVWGPGTARRFRQEKRIRGRRAVSKGNSAHFTFNPAELQRVSNNLFSAA